MKEEGEIYFLSSDLSISYRFLAFIFKPYDHQRMSFYEKIKFNFENLKTSRYKVDTQESYGIQISYDHRIHMSDNCDFRTYGYSKYYKVPKSTFKIKNLTQKALLRGHDN